jgi:DNA-binding response OmpR family regulator
MPGMSGDQLAGSIKAKSPATRVLMLTGFRNEAEESGGWNSIDCILEKPVSLTGLRQAMAKLFLR